MSQEKTKTKSLEDTDYGVLEIFAELVVALKNSVSETSETIDIIEHIRKNNFTYDEKFFDSYDMGIQFSYKVAPKYIRELACNVVMVSEDVVRYLKKKKDAEQKKILQEKEKQ